MRQPARSTHRFLAARRGALVGVGLLAGLGCGADGHAAGRGDVPGDDTVPGIDEPSSDPSTQHTAANPLPNSAAELLPLARRGDLQAQNKLGLFYILGRGVPKDAAEGLTWLRAAADKGLVLAQQNLGTLYESGFGVPKDYGEAAKWYRLAAEQGSAVGENGLGFLYEHGMGVAQNYAEALSWYRKAADQQSSKAQFNLAGMYDRGEGVAKDQAEAVKLLRIGALKGFAPAQVSLGAHYLGGNGTARDPSRAYFWALLGAAHVQPNQTAIANTVRDAAARQLAPDEVTRIQGLATRWTAGTDETALLGAGAEPGAAGANVPGTAPAPGKPVEGTGFLVTRSGFALTNAHVVPACKTLTARAGEGEARAASVVTRDDHNDLALVKIEGAFGRAVAFRDDRAVRPGDDITVFGFPLVGVLSSQGNVTTGTVSALAGIGNDTRLMQISAPLQQGNSGGPVVDSSGNVIGIAVSKLNAVALAKVTGDVAQNVNFAIKESVIRDFLDANGIAYVTAKSAHPLSTADLAERMKAYTVLLTCEG